MIVVSPQTGTPREWNDFVRRQEGWTHFQP